MNTLLGFPVCYPAPVEGGAAHSSERDGGVLTGVLFPAKSVPSSLTTWGQSGSYSSKGPPWAEIVQPQLGLYLGHRGIGQGDGISQQGDFRQGIDKCRTFFEADVEPVLLGGVEKSQGVSTCEYLDVSTRMSTV